MPGSHLVLLLEEVGAGSPGFDVPLEYQRLHGQEHLPLRVGQRLNALRAPERAEVEEGPPLLLLVHADDEVEHPEEPGLDVHGQSGELLSEWLVHWFSRLL